jgi:hypothetical protein
VLTDVLDLLDWKRRIFELYAEIRSASDASEAWLLWRDVRDELFRVHPQSPLPDEARQEFRGLDCYPYDPELRLLADLEPAELESLQIAGSAGSSVSFERFARAVFQLRGERRSLELYWLEGYGGGIFLPFGDATNGDETYGPGRYLLDSVKGADLGMEHGRLVLDFNFAYNPSCSYDPRWACPLAPPANRVPIPIRAGERLA